MKKKFVYDGGEEIPLWPVNAPGAEKITDDEMIVERSPDPLYPERAVSRISEPSMFLFEADKPCGTAVLIAPGGAYERLAIDKEGFDIARWLNTLGITAAVLKYRLPSEAYEKPEYVSLQDAQRAMRMLRHISKKRGYASDKIGALGFSAGGHLIASLAAGIVPVTYTPVDDIDKNQPIPDIAILMYPVVSMKSPNWHENSSRALCGADLNDSLTEFFSLENRDLSGMPPVFLCHASDDAMVPSQNSILLYEALLSKGAQVEMHIFREGGHGFGIRNAKGLPASLWTVLCENWMAGRGFMPGKKNNF